MVDLFVGVAGLIFIDPEVGVVQITKAFCSLSLTALIMEIIPKLKLVTTP